MNFNGNTQNSVSTGNPRWIKCPEREPSTDTELVSAAITAIDCLTTVPLENIRVTSNNNWLRLEGTVSCPNQRITLEQVTRNLPGVRGVTDCIAVS
jgi:osmotically-inducible protein OsmY